MDSSGWIFVYLCAGGAAFCILKGNNASGMDTWEYEVARVFCSIFWPVSLVIMLGMVAHQYREELAQKKRYSDGRSG